MQSSPPAARRSRSDPSLTRKAQGLAAALIDRLHGARARRLAPTFPTNEPSAVTPGRNAASAWPTGAWTWFGVLQRTLDEFNDDHIPVAAAGVTFFALLALFPAIGAFVAVYGLFGDMGDALRLLRALQGVFPDGAVTFISEEVTRIAQTRHSQLGATFFVGLAISIWSSNSAVKALLESLNLAYEARERRGFVKLSLLSLTLTAGGLGVTILLLVAATRLPELVWGLPAGSAPLIHLAKWPLAVAIAVVALSVLYRYGPCRPRASWRWLTPGGLVAGVAWLAMTLAFSTYVLHFGHFDRTYGPLGALIAFMIWMWLGLIVVLFGAELNAEIDRGVGS